jgi:hypothetical protein
VTLELTLAPLQADLVALLRATREAERDLFAALPEAVRDQSGVIGAWSPKDVLAHLAAWRAVEARRMEAARTGSPNPPEDPPLGEPVDESNARIHEDFAGAGWEAVELRADESVEALVHEIGESSTDILCDCQDDIVGIGANGANHAIMHLSEIARLGSAGERYRAFGRELEGILARGHLPPRDSGVLHYNLACHYALWDHLDDARRLLKQAFGQRHDLRSTAQDDPDLEALREELDALAGES